VSYGRVVGRTWAENRLFTVLLELTYACNLDCAFCYNDRARKGRALSTEQYGALLADLAAMQVFQLVLSGGEPLAHPAFYEIGRAARRLGFVVRVKSNGHALDDAVARRLKEEVDPFVVEVSLHGATAETHERQTRVPGSFEKLLRNLEHLREAGLRAKLNATLTRWNEGEVEAMYALADARGLRLSFDATVTPRDDGDLSPLELAASEEGFRRLVRLQRSRSAAGRAGERPDALRPAADEGLPEPSREKHCGAGSSTVTIDPYGDVFPCVQWRVPVGNLHETSIREIWEASPALAATRRLTVEARTAVAGALGDAADFSGFCPGLGQQRMGSPLALYPGVAERARIAAAELGGAAADASGTVMQDERGPVAEQEGEGGRLLRPVPAL
jgi:MoaA/NifB/PqqE/SkfB family radical SAM enzyme